MPCVLKLEPSRLPTLHSGSTPALPCKCMRSRTFNFREIFKRAFKIYGIWPQAQSVGRIHTHLRNAVPLVWGSLRLAPITSLLLSILLQVRSTSNNANGNKRVIFFSGRTWYMYYGDNDFIIRTFDFIARSDACM